MTRFEIFAQMIVDEECAKLNTPEHDEHISRDYSGNTGAYRLASHDGADYSYLSDWYGQAMCGGDLPESFDDLAWTLHLDVNDLHQRWMLFIQDPANREVA